jgi:hypothetical protein
MVLWPPTLPPAPIPKLSSLSIPKIWLPPPIALYAPLPLRVMAKPSTITALAARTQIPATVQSNCNLTSDTVMEYLIGLHNMEMIYLSPDPYGCIFEEKLDLHKWDISKHCTAGLRFIAKQGHLILVSMNKSTPGA